MYSYNITRPPMQRLIKLQTADIIQIEKFDLTYKIANTLYLLDKKKYKLALLIEYEPLKLKSIKT